MVIVLLHQLCMVLACLKVQTCIRRSFTINWFLALKHLQLLFIVLLCCFSAGVGRAGTFCVVYTAIRELNGTGNIGKENICHYIVSRTLSCVLVCRVTIYFKCKMLRASVNMAAY